MTDPTEMGIKLASSQLQHIVLPLTVSSSLSFFHSLFISLSLSLSLSLPLSGSLSLSLSTSFSHSLSLSVALYLLPLPLTFTVALSHSLSLSRDIFPFLSHPLPLALSLFPPLHSHLSCPHSKSLLVCNLDLPITNSIPVHQSNHSLDRSLPD